MSRSFPALSGEAVVNERNGTVAPRTEPEPATLAGLWGCAGCGGPCLGLGTEGQAQRERCSRSGTTITPASSRPAETLSLRAADAPRAQRDARALPRSASIGVSRHQNKEITKAEGELERAEGELAAYVLKVSAL